MQIATVDFQRILLEYKPYKESMSRLEKFRDEFSTSMDFIKLEMDSIMSLSKSIILDDKTKTENIKRMRELQSKASESEIGFREKFSEMQSAEMDKNFKEIIGIVSDWSKKINGLEFVLDKNSVVFHKPELEITDFIIEEIIKLED